MKILIDARFYGLENAGLGRYTANLLDRLQAIDHKNTYFILLRKKYFDQLSFNSNFQKVFVDIAHYSLKEQIEIPKIIDKYNPDLTHFLHFNVPLNFNRKFIVTIHDMTMHSQKTNASTLFLPKYYIKHFVYKKVFKHAVIKSSRIIVPSQFVKDELVKSFKVKNEKAKVIYEGVSNLNSNFKNSFLRGVQKPASHLFLENLNKQDGGLYFLYVGNAYPHKNLEIAIKACVNLKVNLYIVSRENEFTKRLHKLVSKLSAQNYIKFLGNVSDENLKTLYEKSVGFIYPSLAEGFGLPGLEAMCAGTILLSSDIPVFREIYGNHAIYFNPTAPASVKNAIKKVLALNKIEAESMIRENKKFIQRYSWEKTARQTLEVYRECYN